MKETVFLHRILFSVRKSFLAGNIFLCDKICSDWENCSIREKDLWGKIISSGKILSYDGRNWMRENLFWYWKLFY
jgi:hypothetical protein